MIEAKLNFIIIWIIFISTRWFFKWLFDEYASDDGKNISREKMSEYIQKNFLVTRAGLMLKVAPLREFLKDE